MTENDFKPKRKPSMLVEALAWFFLYGPIFTFFYCIVQVIKYLAGL